MRPLSQVANSGLSLPQFSGPALPSYDQWTLFASALASVDLTADVSGLASDVATGGAGISTAGFFVASSVLADGVFVFVLAQCWLGISSGIG